MKVKSLSVGMAGFVVVLASLPAGAATWPTWRASKERTAAVHGEFATAEPQLAFRIALGGEATRAIAFPREAPGTVLSAIGGKLQSLDVASGSVLWETPMLQELTLVGSADLDGDSIAEAVAFTRRQAYVFSTGDGGVIWSSVLGQHSTIAAVRLADLTGDGLAEVLIDDCATCGVAGPLHGEFITFAGGEPRTLWTVPGNQTPQPYHQGTDAVLLGLGSGRPLLGLPTVEDYRLYDAATGQARVIVPRGPYWFAQTAAMVTAQDQVLLLRPTGNAQGALPPAVISLRVLPDEGLGETIWQYAGDVYSTLELSESAVADLDQDGVRELLVSELDREGNWALVVLDLDGGAVLDRFWGWRLETVVPASTMEEPPLLAVTGEQGLTLVTYADHELQPIGNPLPAWEVTSSAAADPVIVNPIRPSASQATDSGVPRLLLGKTNAPAFGAGRYESVGWANVTRRGLELAETFTPNTPITAVYDANGATRPYEQFAVATTDGALTVLDRRLRPSNGSLYRSSDGWLSHRKAQQKTYPGNTVGGRQPARGNLIGRNDGDPFLVIPNTATGTVVVDARNASRVSPAQRLWSSEFLVKPSIFETGTSSVVAGVELTSLVLRDAETGSITAEAALDKSILGAAGTPFNEPILLQSDNDAPLLALDWQLPAVQVAQRGFRWEGASLTEQWTSEPMSWGGGFFSSAGRYQFDETTPTADVLVYATGNTTYFRRADTGSSLSRKVYTGHYTLPIIADFSGDGATDVLFQSGFVSPWLYGPNWSPLWQYRGPLPTYTMAGALVACEAGTRYVTPHLRSSRFIVFDAATGTVVRDSFAASGELFASEVAAHAASAEAGFLSNMSVLADPDGGSLIVFGSTDGYLYAVDGCGERGLVWALNAGTPLAEASIGDWDADGKEEIVVGAASGHVFGIDFGRLSAPRVVLARLSHHHVDIDWDHVEGASGYEYALVQPDGQPAWSPAYRSTRRTHARVNLEKTLAGRPFRIAVRARRGHDAGAEAFTEAFTRSDSGAPRVRAGWDAWSKRLWLGAADNQELDHFLIWAVDDAGKRTFLDDGFVEGRFAQRLVEVDAARASGAQTLAVTVVDAAGNQGEDMVVMPECLRQGRDPHQRQPGFHHQRPPHRGIRERR